MQMFYYEVMNYELRPKRCLLQPTWKQLLQLLASLTPCGCFKHIMVSVKIYTIEDLRDSAIVLLGPIYGLRN